jgi:Folylpolyglutamate synthase
VDRHGLPRFPVLHVVGTNGKGSTATILAELLQAHGLRVGLSVSPHFITPRERILVNGAMLPEETWARLGAQVFAQSEGLGLTYFEVLTALSLAAFEDAGVDVAIMEAGLGGRFDATNVLSPALTVFTPIGMDHMNILGDTLEKIAADKAGAMRKGGLAVAARRSPRPGGCCATRPRMSARSSSPPRTCCFIPAPMAACSQALCPAGAKSASCGP